ncbi:MAG: L-seryl-tRNA(Sec) selenium transferase [Anaerolineales bacterium]
MSDLRQIPSVDHLINSESIADNISVYGRPLTLQAIRSVLADVRSNYSSGNPIPSENELITRVTEQLANWAAPTLLPVINCTGVILHTNLGRAPLSKSSMEAIQNTALNYSTLEYQLDKGRRGSRSIHAESYLKQLTGAEGAFVVNNNASAVLLILSALAKRRKVVIARSQLVEIGGGFRIPDVMAQSGAKLYEIGTTNRVHLHDYEKAIEEESIKLIMRAHRSNFQIVGFTGEPSLAEIVDVSHQAGIPVVDDLGSGSFLETTNYGLGHEPMVQESLSAGADLVCFSGDKLLGGPQAGIIIGKIELIKKLRKHPLARAIRPDKLCLAALSETLLHYLRSEAESEIPVWQMISEPLDQIKSRADRWISEIGQGELVEGKSTIGGGSLPGETLPTYLVAISTRHPDKFLSALRKQQPPIIARLEEDRVLLDPRTVFADQESLLLTNLNKVLNSL